MTDDEANQLKHLPPGTYVEVDSKGEPFLPLRGPNLSPALKPEDIRRVDPTGHVIDPPPPPGLTDGR